MRIITRVRIAKDEIFIGKGVKELLDSIEEHKSIKKACEETSISYPKAIRMLKTLDKELGFPCVISEKGGYKRGGTKLTTKGKEVLEAYRSIEIQVEDFALKLVEKEFKF